MSKVYTFEAWNYILRKHIKRVMLQFYMSKLLTRPDNSNLPILLAKNTIVYASSYNFDAPNNFRYVNKTTNLNPINYFNT